MRTMLNRKRAGCRTSALLALGLVAAAWGGQALADDEGGGSSSLTISTAEWRSSENRLDVSGTGNRRRSVTVVNAYDPSQVLGSDEIGYRGWSIRDYRPSPVPCRVRAIQSDGQTAERNVGGAPDNCAPKAPGGGNTPPTANANGPYSGTVGQAVSFSSAGSTDPGGSIASYAWTFGDGGTSSAANPSHTYAAAGTYTVTLSVTDNDGASGSNSTSATITQGQQNVPPTASANGPYNGTAGVAVSFSSAGSNDPNGSIASYAWTFGDGGTSAAANPSHTYANAATYNVSLTVTDNQGATGSATTSATITGGSSACTTPNPTASINSTSQNGCPGDPVPEQAQVTSSSYAVLAINDLGMHCGDLDTRIASILPPFNVLHAQVVQKGADPTLNPSGVSVTYWATSNDADPILARGAAAFTGLMADGSTFKTNFWDTLNAGAYNAFYPFDIAPYIAPDVGLPVPDSAVLPSIVAAQQSMPGVDGAYTFNDPQGFTRFDSDIQFFASFPFGYTATPNWFAADGIPVSAFDDFGRENAYPLMRVAATQSSGNVVATVDTVTPISGEANCQNCHAAPADGGNGTATTDVGISNPAVSLDDPSFGQVPIGVSVEWASDHNVLKLHDIRNGTSLINGTDQDFPTPGATPFEPVVCQRCHYTPALDLAQVGPNDVNGRAQSNNQSMSRVMHNHHAQTGLFPTIPAPIQGNNGAITNQTQRVTALEESCYQCHPGKNTKCLRGAMFNGDMLCSDCHGNMTQVGNDFSRNMPGGSFILAGDYYTNANTPRVPWANEPGCGSCHTGDASSNLTNISGAVVNNVDTNGNSDGIRLRQAYRTGDNKATPIVPTNKRFAENVVGGSTASAANPKLYRISTGHGGVMCEGCHGATHAEWPVSPDRGNYIANDNQAALQLQGHTGTIVECSTCHGTAMNNQNTLGGPHGMHPVGDNTSFANGGHEHMGTSGCSACHGPGGRSSNTGTVLSVAKADRNLRGTLVAKGEPVGCSVCHGGGAAGTDPAQSAAGTQPHAHRPRRVIRRGLFQHRYRSIKCARKRY